MNHKYLSKIINSNFNFTRIQAVSKIPYRAWIACDAPFKLMSYG